MHLLLQEKEKSGGGGGRLNSIANFFKKLNPNSRKEGGSRNSSPAGDDRPRASGRDDRVGGKWSEPDHHRNNNHTSGAVTFLPPLATDSATHLTSSGTFRKVPSYGQMPNSESNVSMQSNTFTVKTLEELRFVAYFIFFFLCLVLMAVVLNRNMSVHARLHG